MAKSKGQKHAGQANQVRIIGGDFRRRLLRFSPEAGLRPTPDRVRETLFNWLGQDLAGMRVLDAFAGSGALGFEAASRRAARVVMLEASARAVDALAANRTLLGAPQVEIVRTNALPWLACNADVFDLVLLDPPFDSDLVKEALPLAAEHLAPAGWLYVEQDRAALAPEGFIIHRSGTAGQSHFALLRRVG
ncbi:MAG TPA: 16S rRNA (guanine(966)-N(2))-methyltransferase RsmD [Thiobacillaceae bacterium]|nr:16S rRNA (guanine(966)-N(2))-methyltransferase RsmD [Thiobacillaceae bacterium]